MLEAIDECEANKWANLKECLLKISKNSNLSYGDKDPDIIRNKYGNNSAVTKEDGIYFEKLRRLRLVLLHKEDSNSEGFIDSVKDLRQNIINIFYKEQSFLNDQNQNFHEWVGQYQQNTDKNTCHNIIKFVNENYVDIAVKKIEEVIPDNIKASLNNLVSKEDKYYLARILIISGELLREIIECGGNGNQNLLAIARKMKAIRNAIIHGGHHILVNKSYTVDEIKTIYSILYDLKRLRSTQNGDTKNLEAKMDEFAKSIIIPEQLFNKLKNSVKIISNKVEKLLKILNSKKCDVSHITKSLQEVTYYKNFADDQSQIAVLKSCDNELADISLPELPKIPTKDTLENFQENLRKLTESLEKHINDKKVKLLDRIYEEYIYLQEIDDNETLDDNKKHYIKQHITSIIAQYFRDFNEIIIREGKEDISTSYLLNQSINQFLHFRNYGLLHNILDFDEENFITSIYDDILPAFQDVAAVRYIASYSMDLNEYNSKSLYFLGVANMRLGRYDKARDIFQKVLGIIRKEEAYNNLEKSNEYILLKELVMFNLLKILTFSNDMGVEKWESLCSDILNVIQEIISPLISRLLPGKQLMLKQKDINDIHDIIKIMAPHIGAIYNAMSNVNVSANPIVKGLINFILNYLNSKGKNIENLVAQLLGDIVDAINYGDPSIKLIFIEFAFMNALYNNNNILPEPEEIKSYISKYEEILVTHNREFTADSGDISYIRQMLLKSMQLYCKMQEFRSQKESVWEDLKKHIVEYMNDICEINNSLPKKSWLMIDSKVSDKEEYILNFQELLSPFFKEEHDGEFINQVRVLLSRRNMLNIALIAVVDSLMKVTETFLNNSHAIKSIPSIIPSISSIPSNIENMLNIKNDFEKKFLQSLEQSWVYKSDNSEGVTGNIESKKFSNVYGAKVSTKGDFNSKTVITLNSLKGKEGVNTASFENHRDKLDKGKENGINNNGQSH